MKKFIFLIFLTFTFTALFGVAVQAEATIDKSKVAGGIITINLDDFEGKKIKAQVSKGELKYTYTLIKSPVNIPLQMGTGEYKIMVLENTSGDMYKPLITDSIIVESIDETQMYLASVPMIEYEVSTKAIPDYKGIAGELEDINEKISVIYERLVKDYEYDFDLAAVVKDGYVPVIDSVYDAKKGICYDYASVFAGALRSLNIPVKLVAGYVPEVPGYHAWNEILIGDEWIAVDTTYDSQMDKGGSDYSMAKDKSKTTIVRIY